MEMSAYLGQKGVPVALAVPFDGTQSLAASSNIQRVLNLTQRSYAYMRKGPNFKGTLVNFDVSSDPSIDHLNIDKSPRLHAKVIAEVLCRRRLAQRAVPGATPPRPVPVNARTRPAAPAACGEARGQPGAGCASAPPKAGTGAMNGTVPPVIARSRAQLSARPPPERSNG